MEIGPVDVVIVEFPGNKFSGELLPMLTELCASGTIRVIDLIVATKDDEGTIALLELAGIDENLVPAIAELDDRAARLGEHLGRTVRRGAGPRRCASG